MVEVRHHGFYAWASTHEVSKEGVQAALNRAISLAEELAPLRLYEATAEMRPVTKGSFISPGWNDDTDARLTALVPSLLDTSTTLFKAPHGKSSEVTMLCREKTTYYRCSAGSDWSQQQMMTGASGRLTVGRDGKVQNRSTSSLLSHTKQQSPEEAMDDLSEETVATIIEEANQLIDAPLCPETSTNVILDPGLMYIQIHESIGHPLELDRILGDERNFAGWSFVSPEDFGTLTYGSPLMNVTFDPEVPGQLASLAFDDTGTECRREYLIENGILKRGLGGTESQIRSSLPGVASQRATSWRKPAIDRMGNINLEPGTSNFKDMISSIEDGVFLSTMCSWSIDDYRRKFQFGCEVGYEIKDGEIGGMLRNPNYRGETLSFWRSLAAVGSDDDAVTCGTTFCGKGEPNQIIDVGHRSPHCLFRNLNIFGGVA